MNTGLQTNRTPVIIAQEINVIRDQAGKILLQSSLEIGQRLKEAKELVGHGNWGAWVEAEVNYSQRTAQNLIKIYDEYGEKYLVNANNSNTQVVANLSYTQALAMLELDSEERENFLENNDVSEMSTNDIKKAIAEKKAIEEEKIKLEARVKEMMDENEDLKKQMVASEDLQSRIDSLISSQADTVKLKKLEDELKASKDKVKQLENTIKSTPATKTVEVEKIKEVVPKTVQDEIDKLNLKVSMGESTSKFKATFEVIGSLFNDLVKSLEAIKQTDAAIYEKYKETTNKMLERLKQ